MSDVQESYPSPTTGLLKPTQVQLSGSGVTQVAGNVYQVTLSLKGTATVSVTAAAKDVAAADPSYTGAFNWLSYNALPSSANAGDVNESYPTGATSARVATVGAATGSPVTITARNLGQAIIEVSIPAFDVDGKDDYLTSKVYAQLIVNVQA